MSERLEERMTAREIEFWYDFASTYSYLSVMRIEALADAAGIKIRWRPFLLGPIFAAQGWTSSPFTLYPAKGRYMIRDMERICARRGLAFRMPATFPANGISAARVAMVGVADGWIAPYTKAVFKAQFADGRDISERTVLTQICDSLGLDFAGISARNEQSETKGALRRNTEEAGATGIFGAPTFRTSDGELFWGDDRLREALAWAGKI